MPSIQQYSFLENSFYGVQSSQRPSARVEVKIYRYQKLQAIDPNSRQLRHPSFRPIFEQFEIAQDSELLINELPSPFHKHLGIREKAADRANQRKICNNNHFIHFQKIRKKDRKVAIYLKKYTKIFWFISEIFLMPSIFSQPSSHSRTTLA